MRRLLQNILWSFSALSLVVLLLSVASSTPAQTEMGMPAITWLAMDEAQSHDKYQVHAWSNTLSNHDGLSQSVFLSQNSRGLIVVERPNLVDQTLIDSHLEKKGLTRPPLDASPESSRQWLETVEASLNDLDGIVFASVKHTEAHHTGLNLESATERLKTLQTQITDQKEQLKTGQDHPRPAPN